MPQGTREAMLEAVENDRIIVGAYTDSDGGVCPMLAAHRHGGRTNLASFARAWDRYTKARKPRPASERELRTLRTMLQESIVLDDERLQAGDRRAQGGQGAPAQPFPRTA
jgi:hypothetical protein